MVVVGVMGSLERTFRIKLSSGESCSGTESCLGEYSMTGFPRYDFISLIFLFKSSSVPEMPNTVSFSKHLITASTWPGYSASVANAMKNA